MQVIPANVQAQADQADKLLKGLATGEDQNEGKDGVVADDAGKNKPEEETVEGLRHKLSVLQGKYNAEIVAVKDDVNALNSLKKQVRTLTTSSRTVTGQLNEANGLIQQLQGHLAAKAAAVPDPDPGDGKTALGRLSKEDREYLAEQGYEERVIEIIAKMIPDRTPVVQQVVNAEETGQIKRDLKQIKLDTFWKEVRQAIPDFDAINPSDGFNDWLDELLPYSDKTRRFVLDAAGQQLDHGKVIEIFNDYKKAKGIADAPKKKDEPKVDIEPDSSVGHIENTEGDAPKGKIYTAAEVNKFYQDHAISASSGYRTGVYAGKKEEALRIDADIIKANTEGRIRG